MEGTKLKNNNGLISGLVLLSLGLICGLLLAFVNELTVERIEAEELRLKFDAIEEFYDIANYDLEEIVLENGTIYVLKSQSNSEIEHLVYSFRAKGYGEDVEMLVAVNKDLSVEGYTVTYQNESPGIGTKIVGNDFNYNQADDVSTFDSIGGATVSSNAVKAIFTEVSERAQSDFNGGLYDDEPIDEPNELEITVDDFYDSDLFDIEEVEIEQGTIYILRQDNQIEHLVYVISTPGYHDQIEMFVAVNKDLSVEGYIVSYQDEKKDGTKIIDYDFNYNVANDLSTFDNITGATISSNGVRAIFTEIARRVEDDFGGGFDD
jgi:Na+-translocating ferredoxin:NAD+ oxidoreductase RnfG subunit